MIWQTYREEMFPNNKFSFTQSGVVILNKVNLWTEVDKTDLESAVRDTGGLKWLPDKTCWISKVTWPRCWLKYPIIQISV